MKKSNKGFTMVELLAAIVILGLLTALAIPLIMSLMDNSRNKIYISDAKKLVAQAEYKLKANNSSLELPDEDNCIVVSLVYLNSSIFDNPPNGGAYLKENSFVVIKNAGNNKYEYSVMLVEKYKKNSYKGVELISNSTLNSSDATKHIVNFKSSDLVDVSNIQKSYINQKLGNDGEEYISEVEGRYNEPDFDDNSTLNDNDYIPKITSLSLTSSNSMGYNFLNAELQLRVVDKDTPYTNLTVSLSTKGYDEANDTTKKTYQYCTDAASCSSIFSRSINFTEFGNYTYDGSTVNLYIVVKDKDNNETRKTIKYIIHKNTAPKIDTTSSSITKRDYDRFAMTTALVKLSVTDDIDKLDQLQVCFKESENENDQALKECSNYQRFSDVFTDGEFGEYTFNCGGSGCARNGTTHYLAVFVKDSLGEVTSTVMNYTFSINSAPTISQATVVSKEEPFTTEKSKDAFIRVSATDQEDSLSDLKVIVSGGVETKTYSYNDNGYDNYFSYAIANNYPKNNESISRNIKIRVEDSEGGYAERTIPYELFVDTAPTISIVGISSNGFACTNTDYCPLGDNKNGSKKVDFDISVSDKIDYEDDKVYVCITDSNTSSNCTVNNNYTMGDNKTVPRNNYVKYSQLKGKQFNVDFSNWSYNENSETNDIEKTIYIFAKDQQGLESSKNQKYYLYKNKAPDIKTMAVENRGEVCLDENNNVCTSSTVNKKVVEDENSYNVKLTIEAEDDFNETSSLKYCVTESSSCEPNTPYQDSIEFDLSNAGKYNDSNNKKNIKLFVKDSDNKVSQKTVEYDVYKNKAPNITTFKIYSNGYACSDESICPNECNNPSGECVYEGGSKNVSIQVDVDEDFDKDTFINNNQICIKENNSSDNCTFESFSEFNNKLKSKTYNWNYDGSTKKLYAFAKDSNGVISEGVEAEYKLYKDRGPIVNDISIKSSFAGEDEEYPNGVYATFNLNAKDDFSSSDNIKVSYCYKVNGGSEVCPNAYKDKNYTESMELGKDFFSDAIGTSTATTTQILAKTYKVYAKLKDANNNSTTTEELEYGINAVTDKAPLISSVNIESSDDRQHLIISAFVVDENDYYSICISKNNTTCTNYITTGKICADNSCEEEKLKGDGTQYYIDYSLTSPINNGDSLSLYAFIKDSYDKKGRIVDENDDDNTILAFPYTIYNQTYNECSVDDTNGIKYEYIYTFDANKEYTDNEYDDQGNIIASHTYKNKKITPDICQRQCYRYDSEGVERNIFGFYDKKITYFDRFNSNTKCSLLDETVDYKAYCDFKDCFKFTNYSNNVVGTTERYEDSEGDPVNYTYTNSTTGKTYICTSNYYRYISSYTDGDENITLTKTEPVCAQYIDDPDIDIYSLEPNLVRVID